jgi:hypothetical protein
MLGTIKIRFLHPWERYMPGDVIQPPAGMREELIRRGYAEVVIEPDAPETAMVEPQTEKAVKRRGRPRIRQYVDGKPVRTRKKVKADVS